MRMWQTSEIQIFIFLLVNSLKKNFQKLNKNQAVGIDILRLFKQLHAKLFLILLFESAQYNAARSEGKILAPNAFQHEWLL